MLQAFLFSTIIVVHFVIVKHLVIPDQVRDDDMFQSAHCLLSTAHYVFFLPPSVL